MGTSCKDIKVPKNAPIKLRRFEKTGMDSATTKDNIPLVTTKVLAFQTRTSVYDI